MAKHLDHLHSKASEPARLDTPARVSLHVNLVIMAKAVEEQAAVIQREFFTAVEPVLHGPNHLGLTIGGELYDRLMPVVHRHLIADLDRDRLDHLFQWFIYLVDFGYFQPTLRCPDLPTPQVPILMIEAPEIQCFN